jgi:hypothetical protein
MAVIYSKRPKNLPTFSISRLSKIYPDRDFWFENIPSGNLGCQTDGTHQNYKTIIVIPTSYERVDFTSPRFGPNFYPKVMDNNLLVHKTQTTMYLPTMMNANS